MKRPMLSVRNLSISKASDGEDHLLLAGVDLEVRPGEALGVVGESGAGKTLLARALLGLLPPGVRITAGTIHFAGTELTSLPLKQRRKQLGRHIGMIFQDPASSLDPLFDVRSQLVEALRVVEPLDRQPAEAAARELLERVDLPGTDLLDRYPHQLSGGQQQRLSIALALAARPELLIADEPTTALDPPRRRAMIDLWRRLQRNLDTTMVLLSHDFELVEEVCDQVLVLYRGHPAELAPTGTWFEQPLHPMCQALLHCSRSQQIGGTDSNQPLPTLGRSGADPGVVHGCVYFEQCSIREDICQRKPPPFVEATSGHSLACHVRQPGRDSAAE